MLSSSISPRLTQHPCAALSSCPQIYPSAVAPAAMPVQRTDSLIVSALLASNYPLPHYCSHEGSSILPTSTISTTGSHNDSGGKPMLRFILLLHLSRPHDTLTPKPPRIPVACQISYGPLPYASHRFQVLNLSHSEAKISKPNKVLCYIARP